MIILLLKMEVRVGFEPTVVLLCRQLPWTARPPHYDWLRWRESNPVNGFGDRCNAIIPHRNETGAPGENRTPDPRITSALLYLLNYKG